MESLIAAIRHVHVAAGTLALFVAPIPMLTAKGGGSHRRWGKVYFWAMAGVAATAIVLAVWKPVVFLALLAVFSLDRKSTRLNSSHVAISYAVFCLKKKKNKNKQTPH